MEKQEDIIFPKLNLEGFMLMDNPIKCPNCNGHISSGIDIIGWGEYPAYGQGRFAVVKGKIGLPAVAFECGLCFTKCCCHVFSEGYLTPYRHLYEYKIESQRKGIDISKIYTRD